MISEPSREVRTWGDGRSPRFTAEARLGDMTSTSTGILTPTITTPDTQRVIPFLGELYRVRVSGADTAGRFAGSSH
jgi:hypothetical protein